MVKSIVIASAAALALLMIGAPARAHHSANAEFDTQKEFTITGEYRFINNFFTRLEYRRDWSDQAVFERGQITGATKNQDTFVIGLVAYFPPPKN